jgi:hypothetical protein
MEHISRLLESTYDKMIESASDDFIVTISITIFALILLKGFSNDRKKILRTVILLLLFNYTVVKLTIYARTN